MWAINVSVIAAGPMVGSTASQARRPGLWDLKHAVYFRCVLYFVSLEDTHHSVNNDHLPFVKPCASFWCYGLLIASKQKRLDVSTESISDHNRFYQPAMTALATAKPACTSEASRVVISAYRDMREPGYRCWLAVTRDR